MEIDSPVYMKAVLELVANNLAARCVNGRGLVTFKVSWQVGGWVGEYHGGRGTNESMTYYLAEYVMVNPLQMKDNVGERRGRKRMTEGLGEHMTRWRCVWTRMGFCAADNLNAFNSNDLQVYSISASMPKAPASPVTPHVLIQRIMLPVRHYSLLSILILSEMKLQLRSGFKSDTDLTATITFSSKEVMSFFK